MEPLVIVAAIGFAGQIGVALINVLMSHNNGKAIEANGIIGTETHKIVNSQRTVMEARIEELEKMISEVRSASKNGGLK